MQVLKEFDSWLAFLQSIGSTDKSVFKQMNSTDFKNIDIKDIISNLEAFANDPNWINTQNKADQARRKAIQRQAEQLAQTKDYILRFTDGYKYNKFDDLGNFGLSSQGLMGVYRVAEDIRKDISIARDWLKSYKQFVKFLSILPPSVDVTHEQLVMLGKSILARAVELTPMKTGYLRKSATLMVFKDHIRIMYTAPYASFVHDNMEVSHPVHPSNPNCGGRAKFLETAVQEFFPDTSSWIEVLGSGQIEVIIGINPLYIEYLHYS